MSRPPRPLIVAVAAWDTVWKAIAIFRAYRHGQRRWVLPLLLSNTAGVLPIVYLAFFQRRDDGKDEGDYDYEPA